MRWNPRSFDSSHVCWLEIGSKSSMSRGFIHIDAQDAQDFFQEETNFQCRESAKPHRIIA